MLYNISFYQTKSLKLFLLEINNLNKQSKNIYIIICYIKLFVIHLHKKFKTKVIYIVNNLKTLKQQGCNQSHVGLVA